MNEDVWSGLLDQFVDGAYASAKETVDGQRFDAVLCHGVLGYLDNPEPLIDQLCRCATDGGIVSIMTANAEPWPSPLSNAALTTHWPPSTPHGRPGRAAD